MEPLIRKELESELLPELTQTALAYQTGHTPAELALLAELFAESLEGEADWPTIARAFAAHRKTCKRFPTPAHIVELLPECRIIPRRKALPEGEGKYTAGYGKQMCDAILAKLRGGRNTPANPALQNVVASAMADIAKECRTELEPCKN